MQNYIDNEEAEETLSLCDLPLHSNEPDPLENNQSSSSSSSSLSLDQDLFEFFSGGWSTSTATTNISPDHVIFCGKQIPSKQSVSTNDQFFRRNSDSSFYKCSKILSSSYVSTPPPRSNSLPSPIHVNSPTGKLEGKNDIFLKRGANLSSITKSRWFLFMFGNMTSVHKKMELNDLRSRQSWGGRPAMTVQSDGGGDEKLVGGGHHATTVWKSTFSCFGGL